MAAVVPVDSGAAGAGSVEVSVTVTSSTILNVTGCAPDTVDVTVFEPVPIGSADVTDDDCEIGFGATGQTASLQLHQEDGTGSALAGMGDRAATWTSLNTGTTQHLRALAALPDGRLWTSGYNGTLLYSANGGDTWAPQTNPADDTLRDLYAVNANVIWGTGWTGNIIRTVDGGTTWTQVGKQAPVTGDLRGGVRAIDDQTAWVGSSGGWIYKTTNGGTSWVGLSTGAPSQFWGMDLVGTSIVWAVGYDGQIVRTDDGGTTWDVQRVVNGQHLYRIDAFDANHAVAAGAGGLVLHTTDAGATWTSVAKPATGTLDGVAMLSQTHWIIVGYNGVILETDDAGATWQFMASGTGADLRALWAPDAVSIWTVGESGVALRAPVNPIPDYDDAAGNDFATGGAGFFGACLRVADQGADSDATTWEDNATCPESDGTWWNAIPATANADAIVARTTVPVAVGTPGRALLRFAFRPPAGSSPGSYRSRLIATVSAPG